MDKFLSPKTFALTVGLLLFLFGVFGFAFKTTFDVADKYLLISIILGFWGVGSAFSRDL